MCFAVQPGQDVLETWPLQISVKPVLVPFPFAEGGSPLKQEAPMWTISGQPSLLQLADLVLFQIVKRNIYCYSACRNSFFFLLPYIKLNILSLLF